MTSPAEIIITPQEVGELWRDLFPRNAKLAAANAINLAVSGGWLERQNAKGVNKNGEELWSEFAAGINRGDHLLAWNERVRAPNWDWLANLLPKGLTFPKRETLRYDCQVEHVSIALTAYARKLQREWAAKKRTA